MGYYHSVGKRNSSQNEMYDNYCVQGIKKELDNLIKQTVRVDTPTRSYVGIINSVDCNVVSLEPSTGTVATIISICKIEAIIPATTTVINDFDLGDIDNKA
ncbi:hypothetical protein ACTFRP_31630 [Bacillus cereus group sp. MYBK234-1]|uniref:hypothetical protein n=1 Tax=unclassified Bacillus cereus group TaxID=2750818 RepID=UPI003F7A2C63